MTVRFTVAARWELEEAREWYEAKSEGLGDRFARAVEEATKTIEAMPNAWQRLSSDARRYRVKRFPYGVAYMVRADVIVILAVGHLHRKPAYWNAVMRRPQP